MIKPQRGTPRVLLVNPPYPYNEIPIMPMGLAYIAAALESNGHQVRVLDLLVSKCTQEKVSRELAEWRPDLVGVTSVTMNYPSASEILRWCKSSRDGITTIIGGPHVTFCAADTLNEAPWIDVVVRGEGDRTILDIVSGKPHSEIAGIAYRSNGIEITPDRPLIRELDMLPRPARHLFPLSKYLALGCHYSIVAGRGCPFDCIFCVGSKMGGRRARFRDPKSVVDEIEEALASGFTEINFEDDLLTLNHRHVYAVCDEIEARGLKFNWSAFSRVDTVDPPLLRRMRDAGCTWLLYGVESGSQQILDTVRKKTSLDTVKEAVRMAKEAGIKVMASFIIGLPGETRETISQTIEFASGLDTSWGFNVLSPFPGTEVRERAGHYGVEILTDDWSKYDANTVVSRTAGAGPEEIAEALEIYHATLREYLVEVERSGKRDMAEVRQANERVLAWTILQNDTIEGLGAVEAGSDPVKQMAFRVAEAVSFPEEQVIESLRGWVERGLLQYQREGDRTVWRWS